jgi:hypothetical protein
MVSSKEIGLAIRKIANKIDRTLAVHQFGPTFLVCNKNFEASVEIDGSKLKITISIRDLEKFIEQNS